MGASTKPGTPVNVLYTDGYDRVYLHGHLDEAEAGRIAAEFVLNERIEHGYADEGDTLPRYGRAKHRHARWVFADESMRSEGYTQMLNDHAAPGRGAFRMTVVFDLDEIEREEERKRRRQAKVDGLVAAVRARYPEAEIHRAASFGVEDAHVVFALPGLAGKVGADSRTWPDTVDITEEDRAAWARLYQGRSHRLEEVRNAE